MRIGFVVVVVVVGKGGFWWWEMKIGSEMVNFEGGKSEEVRC
tara:strand:+ start:147 stop:272 length:126 start_codon:yes stop_codon:yes gene_type:complete